MPLKDNLIVLDNIILANAMVVSNACLVILMKERPETGLQS